MALATPTGTLRESILSLNGFSLSYCQGPTAGPPLVLLHGVTRCWQTFLVLFPVLTLRWEVLAFDFSGHGRSSRKASSYRVVDYLDDALLLLRQGVHRPAVLYGHSLGAMVALAAAAQEPSRVRGLILEDPPFHAMGRRLPGSPLHSFFLGIHHALREDLSLAGLTSRLAALRVPDPAKNQGRTLGELRDITSLRFTAKCLKQMDPGVLC